MTECASMRLQEQIEMMLSSQKRLWPLVGENYAALSRLKKTYFTGYDSRSSYVEVQYNPQRLASSSARVDEASLRARKCFLCVENQPREQATIVWREKYKIQVNPYPIFSRHFTIAALEHAPQRIMGRVGDLLRLAEELPDYVVFYNGPRCGASVPDHFHFQAGVKSELPICGQIEDMPMNVSIVTQREGGMCKEEQVSGFLLRSYGRMMYHFACEDARDAVAWHESLQDRLPRIGGDEAGQNVLCWTTASKWPYHMLVFPRTKHRPSFYGTEEGHYLLSPASVDMGGLVVLAREEDFDRITVDDVMMMYCEVTRDEANFAASWKIIEEERAKALSYLNKTK